MALEEQAYPVELVAGQATIDEMQNKNGLRYSVALTGTRPNQEQPQLLGYAIAYEDVTDEGLPSIYLDDIAIAPDCQGQGLAWNILQKLVERIKERVRAKGGSIILDMHLRPHSQRLFEAHRNDLAQLGVILKEDALVPDYYDEGEDALYYAYEVKA